jgi:hypothetical protein
MLEPRAATTRATAADGVEACLSWPNSAWLTGSLGSAPTGRGAAWLARQSGGLEVVGSSPTAPIGQSRWKQRVFFVRGERCQGARGCKIACCGCSRPEHRTAVTTEQLELFPGWGPDDRLTRLFGLRPGYSRGRRVKGLEGALLLETSTKRRGKRPARERSWGS